MQQVDQCDVDYSLEDCTRQQDNFLRTANSFHVRGYNKYTRSVQCIVFMITGVWWRKWPRMNMDWNQWRTLIWGIWECHLRCWRSGDLCPWVKQLNTCLWACWQKSSLKAYWRGMKKFFCTVYFEGTLEENHLWAPLHGIQKCFIIIQNQCVQAALEELSRLVTGSASQQPATLNDFQTQELAIEMQMWPWEIIKLQPIGSLQEESAKKYCCFQISERNLIEQDWTLLCRMQLEMRIRCY